MPILGCGAEMAKLMDVSDHDVQAIEDALKARMRQGEGRAEAQRGAIDDVLADLGAEREHITQAVHDKHGPPSDVQRAVDTLTQRWANAPDTVVFKGMQDPQLPERVRQADLEQRSGGANGDVEGFYYKGKVYINADVVHNERDAARVLMHEALGHYGLRGTFGNALDDVLRSVVTSRRAEVEAKAKEYGLDMSLEDHQLQAAEEVLAVMAQEHPELGFVRRAIAAVRTWLRENVPGFDKVRVSDDEIIRDYILPARRFVETGNKAVPEKAAGPVPEPAPAYSRAPGYDDAVDKAIRDATTGVHPGRGHIDIGHPSTELQSAGLPDQPLRTSPAILSKALFDHGVTKSLLKKVPDLLDKPVMVFKSDTQEGSYVVATSEFVGGKPLLVVLNPESGAKNDAYTFMPSLYPKDYVNAVKGWIDRGLLTYADKQQSPDWFSSARLQLPRDLQTKKGSPVAIVAPGGGDGKSGGDGPMFSRASNTTWDAPPDTRADQLIQKLQDGRVDLKRVQAAIAESTKKPVEEDFDARRAETLYPGRVADRADTFMKDEAKPLLEAMAKNNVPMAELSDYLLARHAPERNAQVAKVNPDMPDGGAGTNSKGELMTTQAAKDYLAAISSARLTMLKLLANRVDAITRGTRDILVNEGLESKDTIKAWDAAYKHYVPLFKDEAIGYASHPQGSGFNVKGSASKRAMGSEGEVTNMLAHVLMAREAAITRAEKNRVAMSLYGLALTHPNSEFWTTIKPNMKSEELAASLQRMGVDPQAMAGMDLAPTVRSVDPNTGVVVTRPNPLYKNMPNALTLKVDGQDRVILFNDGNDRAMRLVENLKNLDGMTGMDIAGSLVGRATRLIAGLATQYNPAFGMVNVMRDAMAAAVNLTNTKLAGKQAQVMGNMIPAAIGIARDIAGKNRTEWSDLYKQFREDGGQTGYREALRDPMERTKRIEAELKSLAASKLNPAEMAKKGAHAVLGLLDGFNTTLENSTRLAAYKVALDNGMSRPEAARLARELTVDFNRKGSLTPVINPLYAFFNASLQGTARHIEALKGPAGKMIISGGLGLGVAQAILLASAGIDDDEIPDFVKSKAFVIPTGAGKYVSIPLPQGLNALPNTGRVLTELLMSGMKLPEGWGSSSNDDWGKKLFNALGEIVGGLSPVSGGNVLTAAGAARTVSPTLTDPLVDLAMNQSFTGAPISKETMPGDPRPGYLRAREKTLRTPTGEAFEGIARAVNAISGGGDFKKGVVSPTPEEVKYLTEAIGGGLLREVERAVNASILKARDEEVPASSIPLGSRFAGEIDDDQVQRGRFFKNKEKIGALKAELMGLAKSGQGDAAEKLATDNPVVGLYKINDGIQAKIAKLNKLAMDNLSDKAALRDIDEARGTLMRALNDNVKTLEKASEKQKTAAKLVEESPHAEDANQDYRD